MEEMNLGVSPHAVSFHDGITLGGLGVLGVPKGGQGWEETGGDSGTEIYGWRNGQIGSGRRGQGGGERGRGRGPMGKSSIFTPDFDSTQPQTRKTDIAKTQYVAPGIRPSSRSSSPSPAIVVPVVLESRATPFSQELSLGGASCDSARFKRSPQAQSLSCRSAPHTQLSSFGSTPHEKSVSFRSTSSVQSPLFHSHSQSMSTSPTFGSHSDSIMNLGDSLDSTLSSTGSNGKASLSFASESLPRGKTFPRGPCGGTPPPPSFGAQPPPSPFGSPSLSTLFGALPLPPQDASPQHRPAVVSAPCDFRPCALSSKPLATERVTEKTFINEGMLYSLGSESFDQQTYETCIEMVMPLKKHRKRASVKERKMRYADDEVKTGENS